MDIAHQSNKSLIEDRDKLIREIAALRVNRDKIKNDVLEKSKTSSSLDVEIRLKESLIVRMVEKEIENIKRIFATIKAQQ